MKRSTLILLILAIALGTAVYYLEYKPGKPRDEESATTSKPAWEIKTEDIASIEIRRGSDTIALQAEGERWMITQPLPAPANDAAVRGLLSDLTGLTIEREFGAGNPDELKSYGLVPPALRIEMKLRNGQTRVVELGEKDVLGTATYARLDGGANIAMVGSTILTSAGKSISEFRDRTLLGNPSITPAVDLAGLKVVNGAGSFELEQKNGSWRFVAPAAADADETEISTFLTSVATAEAREIVSETQEQAAQYGLAAPKVSLTARLVAGGERTIAIGAKDGDDYYAKVSDKPQIFKISAATFEQLTTAAVKLKSKVLVKFNRDELKSIRIRNANLTLIAERSDDGKWLIKEPAEKSGQEASAFNVIDPFETPATEVIEKPTPAILALLSKPVIEAQLTDQAGKVTSIRFSAAKEGSAYARVEGRSDIYKIPDSVIDNLGFKPDQIGASSNK
ncbi:MAG: DUF4340 domain-containing protein [Acidobacteriota bacterium]